MASGCAGLLAFVSKGVLNLFCGKQKTVHQLVHEQALCFVGNGMRKRSS